MLSFGLLMANGTQEFNVKVSECFHLCSISFVFLHFCTVSGGKNHEKVRSVLCNKRRELIFDGKHHKPKRKSSLTTIIIIIIFSFLLSFYLVFNSYPEQCFFFPF